MSLLSAKVIPAAFWNNQYDFQEVKKGEMEAGATEYWEAVPLIVPPVPPTGLGGTCSVIEVRYE